MGLRFAIGAVGLVALLALPASGNDYALALASRIIIFAILAVSLDLILGYGGMVSFEPAKGDLKRVLAELAARNVRVAGSADRVRVATHIFTQSTELNTFLDAIDRGLRG